MKIRDRLGILAACGTLALAPCAVTAGDRAEIGIEVGAVAVDEAFRPVDGDEIAPVFGFKFIAGVYDGWGWFAGLDYFAADAPALQDDPSAFVARFGSEWILNDPGSTARFFLDFGGGVSQYEFDGDDAVRALATLGLGQRINVGSTHTIGWEVRANQDLSDSGTIEDRMLHLQGLLSFNWGSPTPPADTDGDGVIDRRDDCPGTPRGSIVDDRGCPSDSDGDGVYDGIDRCPGTPKGWPVDLDGCPADSDGDGVLDGEDDCPDTPAGAAVNDRGCPIDTDGDGVYDGLDQCPDTPAGATVDENGCPADSDGDGVYDGIDRCPDTPAGVAVDDLGCPMDSDGDGVYDGIDRCPDTPRGTAVDENGCPSFGEKTARGAFVLRGVNFELNSATLTGGSHAILDLVAQTLTAYPEAIVEVSGHTDTTGSASYNLTLSEKRASAVRDYLIAKGIDGDRLRAKGYGESSPIAEGNTEDAHAQNRRVEVRKVN